MPPTPGKEAAKPPVTSAASDAAAPGEVVLIDVVSNRTYPINSPVSRFGRDISNDVVLTGDKSLSRFHFQVTIVNNEYFVEDAGSRNGTFLNGAPVTAPKKLLNGDIVSAGMSRYRLVIGGEAMPDNSAGEAAAAALAEKAENEQPSKPSIAQQAIDPLKKIMEEGHALLGGSLADPISDAQDFLNGKNGGDGSASPPKYLELNRGEETPIDDLFQEKIDKNRDRTATEEYAKPIAQEIEDAFAAAMAGPADWTPPPAPESEAAPHSVPAPEPAPKAEARKDWPQWCQDYNFPEVSEFKNKMATLETEIRERQEQLAELQACVSKTEDVRNRVLATTGRELVEACSEVLQLLGWETGMNAANENEVVVSHEGTAQAIAKIVTTDGSQPRPQELATLLSSLSTYWCDNGVEPKGVLIVSMMGDWKPVERPDFSKDIVEYAAKKNVCLLSTVQLLSMYRDITLREAKPDDIRAEILGASGGLLKGFEAAKG